MPGMVGGMAVNRYWWDLTLELRACEQQNIGCSLAIHAFDPESHPFNDWLG